MMRWVWLALALLPSFAAAQSIGQPGPTPTIVPFVAGNLTPVAGSAMKIDYLLENSTVKLQTEAGIWPTQTSAYLGVSKEFTAASTPGTAAGSPLATFFSYAVANGTDGDVVAMIGDVNVKASSGVGFGSNVIARSAGGGLTNIKLVGLEIDVEPAVGDTLATGNPGGGLFLNAFNSNVGPAILIGGLGGGTFANGLLVGAISSTGSAFAAAGGASMKSFMDTTNGTFADQAIVLGNTHRIKFAGISGFSATEYVDSSGNWRFVPPGNGGFFIRTGTDAGNTFQIASNGQVIVGQGSAIPLTSTQFQLLIPFTAGTPTGVPSNNAGGIAIQYDTTGKKIWVYDNVSATWKSVGVI